MDPIPAPPPMPAPAGAVPRTRPLSETPALAARAAQLLPTPQALLPLSAADAERVVACMRLVDYPKGWTLFREGDERSSDYLLLLLEGEVSVDTGDGALPGAVAISVLGAGSVIGEMALLDGAPRSASCHALSHVRAAGLSRRGFEQLIDEHPRVGARLTIALAQRTAERLRALGQQLQMYAQLTASLQQQVAALQARQP